MSTILLSWLTVLVLCGLIVSPAPSAQAAFCTSTSTSSTTTTTTNHPVAFSSNTNSRSKKTTSSSSSSSPLSTPLLTTTTTTTTTTLYRRKEKPSWFDEREDLAEIQPVRYLGKGKNAIIRPGVVLVAPDHEYNHYLTKSVVFIYAIGLDRYGDRVTRGVVIDHPTVFTMGEMAPGTVFGVLANNLLFQGGDKGGDGVIMLHNNGGVGKGVMIGSSGIYEGGLSAAMDTVDDGDAEAEMFKFFFNYVDFNDIEVANMMSAIDSDGDGWMSAEVPIEMVLDSDMNRSDAWRSLRRELKTIVIEDPEYEM